MPAGSRQRLNPAKSERRPPWLWASQLVSRSDAVSKYQGCWVCACDILDAQLVDIPRHYALSVGPGSTNRDSRVQFFGHSPYSSLRAFTSCCLDYSNCLLGYMKCPTTAWGKSSRCRTLPRASLLCPAPRVGGIKRWCASDVCLSRTSGLSREQRGLGRLKLAQR